MPEKTKKGKRKYIKYSQLIVLYILLKYSDENNLLTKKKVMQHINNEFGLHDITIDNKTLDRSLDAISEFYEIKNDLLGQYKCGTDNNKKRKTNIRIEHIFHDYELRYLIDMVSSCDYIVKEERRDLIKKLMTLTSENFHSKFKPYVLNDTKKSKVMVNEFMRNMKVIHKAIIEKKQIKFCRLTRTLKGSLLNEKDKDGNEIIYTVNPYRTVFNDGFYYLVCSKSYDDNRIPDRISNYRIDRMSEIEIIYDPVYFPETSIANAPKNVDTKKYISTHRMMWGGKTETIIFRCPEWAITEIIDFFGDDYNIISHEKKEAIIKVSVESTFDNMLIWARRFFDFVEVISPPSLREKLKDDISKAYEKYCRND
jgi:hypothetical protein